MIDNNVCRTDGADCIIDGKNEDGGDTVTLISPGLAVMLPVRSHALEVEYRGEIARYGNLSSEDYEDHNLRGGFQFNSPMGFKASLEDRFRKAHDPRGFSQNIELDFFSENTARASLGQALGSKLSVEGSYQLMTVNYDASRNDFRDRKEGTAGAATFYRFQPRTSALLEFRWTDVSYDKKVETESRDSTVLYVLGGVTYDISAKTRGVVKAGVENRNFKNGDRGDYSGLALSVDVDHELTPKTSLKGTLERVSRESNLAAQDYYLETGGSLAVRHRFTDKISGDGAISFARESYPADLTIGSKTDKRVDNTVKGGIGVEYWVTQWFNVGGRIDLEKRGSTFGLYDYSDQRYSMTVALVL
jgi:hypothetical protein